MSGWMACIYDRYIYSSSRDKVRYTALHEQEKEEEEEAQTLQFIPLPSPRGMCVNERNRFTTPRVNDLHSVNTSPLHHFTPYLVNVK